MTETAKDTAVASAAALLTHYSFELGGYTAEQLIDRWLRDYDASWVRLAVIEALYQGRYKAVSVAQILACWQRRGDTLYHFNGDFERLVCRKFPDRFVAKRLSWPAGSPVSAAVASPRGGEAPLPRREQPKALAQEGEELGSATPAPQSDATPEPPALTPSEDSDWLEEVRAAVMASVESAAAADSLPAIPTGSPPPAAPPPPPPQPPEPDFASTSAPIPRIMGKTLADLLRLAAEVSEPAALEPVPAAKTNEAPSQWKPKKVPQVKYQADWSRWEAIKNPIVRFMPAVESSEFHAKLKAVAQQPEDSAADRAGTTAVTELDVETEVPVEE
ncbi:hypothetical protein [Kamptonema formosum]|uniref:hypothetical protein n=1 Tax=Kamptonema formosum TaxID=331992 RepID=UPI00034B38E4|nr:hypothetical protein [Oscillatoria sp. PCC 10802]